MTEEYQTQLADAQTNNLKLDSERKKQQKTIENLSTRMTKMVTEQKSISDLKAKLAKVENEKLVANQKLQDKNKIEKLLNQNITKLTSQNGKFFYRRGNSSQIWSSPIHVECFFFLN